MIIDKKGKLFGKINIIDLLIIAVVIAAVGIVGYKYFYGGETAATASSAATITFYAEEITDFVLDGTINQGDEVYDVQEKVSLGTVTGVEYSDAVSYTVDSDGNYVQTSKPGHKSVILTAEVYGTEFANGIIIADNKYYIGHSMTIAAGKAKMYLRISDIEFSK